MKIKAWLLIFTVLLCYRIPLALENDCPPQEISIFFVNGIWTSEDEAQTSIDKLDSVVREEISIPESRIVFEASYNPTSNLLLDLFESTLQLLNGDTARLSRMVEGIEEMPEDVKQSYFNELSVIDSITLLEALTLDAHIDAYERAIACGQKVVLVAHSQGNLFANQAYRELVRRGFNHPFDMVAVATPDSIVESGDRHVTFFEDKVAFFFPADKLSPNTHVTNFLPTLTCGLDVLCHGFVSAYMRSSNAREKIVGHILDLITGTVKGTILVFSPIDITGAVVELRDPDSRQTIFSVQADSTGFFQFDSVPLGEYLLHAEKDAGSNGLFVGEVAVSLLAGQTWGV